ncbi:MAG TPA: phosphatase PAP2 family protein [Burkholderiaceae bacterium]
MSIQMSYPILQYPAAISTTGPAPDGWRRVGLAAPAGVLPPPGAATEAQELAYVENANAVANASPELKAFTEAMAAKGGMNIWMQFAKQYRHEAGFVRGWLGTGLMAVAMGVTALKTQTAKNEYDRLRPYQIDGNIKPIGKIPTDKSYPSGHSSAAYAAATVLGALWPMRAYEFNFWARQVALSRMSAGVHFPSDVQTGAILGTKIGIQAASIMV